MTDRQVNRFVVARQRLAEAAAHCEAADRAYRDAIAELETAGSALAERALLNHPTPTRRTTA